MPHIEANGTEIYVETHGAESGTPIVLVRGLGSQIIHWPQDMLDRLVAAGFFVVTADNRDAGLSQSFDAWGKVDEAEVQRCLEAGEPFATAYRLQDMAADQIGVMGHFGLRTAHVAGVSMGGMIVQLMAAYWPARVRSMTSIMSSSGNPEIPLGTPQARALLLAEPDDPTDRQSVIDFTVRCDRVWGSPAYPFDEAEHRALIGRAYDRRWTPEGVRRQWAAARAGGSRVELLRTITVPSLVIYGLDDTLLQPEHGRDVAKNIPGCDLVEIPGMGHDLHGGLGRIVADHVIRHARASEAES